MVVYFPCNLLSDPHHTHIIHIELACDIFCLMEQSCTLYTLIVGFLTIVVVALIITPPKMYTIRLLLFTGKISGGGGRAQEGMACIKSSVKYGERLQKIWSFFCLFADDLDALPPTKDTPTKANLYKTKDTHTIVLVAFNIHIYGLNSTVVLSMSRHGV